MEGKLGFTCSGVSPDVDDFEVPGINGKGPFCVCILVLVSLAFFSVSSEVEDICAGPDLDPCFLTRFEEGLGFSDSVVDSSINEWTGI